MGCFFVFLIKTNCSILCLSITCHPSHAPYVERCATFERPLLAIFVKFLWEGEVSFCSFLWKFPFETRAYIPDLINNHAICFSWTGIRYLESFAVKAFFRVLANPESTPRALRGSSGGHEQVPYLFVVDLQHGERHLKAIRTLSMLHTATLEDYYHWWVSRPCRFHLSHPVFNLDRPYRESRMGAWRRPIIGILRVTSPW